MATKKRHTGRSKRKTLTGQGVSLLRAVVLEGAGILLLAGVIGYPILTQNQGRFSCLDAQPSVIDHSLHTLLAKVGLVNKPD
ncbi:hypothetical protein [Bremerella cremea]|uniref:hypothetical protein n=1 Tax=Bremerella cremea TaxID=1031537 RepID=UPI0031E7485A